MTNSSLDVFYTPLAKIKNDQLFVGHFYTPKRTRTAVAGMRIPSPRPLDDGGKRGTL